MPKTAMDRCCPPSDENAAVLVRYGRALRRLRRKRGFSLREVAERSGVSARVVSELERGCADPALSLLADLTHAVDATLCDLEA